MICPQCGFENRESAKFCLKCAQQLVPLGHDVDAAVEQPAAGEHRHRRSRFKQKARRAAEKLAALKPQRTAHHDGDTVFLEPAYNDGDTVLLTYSSEAPDSVSAAITEQGSKDDAAPVTPAPPESIAQPTPVPGATSHPWSRYAMAGGLVAVALGWAVYAMTAHHAPKPMPADAEVQARAPTAAPQPAPPPVVAANDNVLILPRLEPVTTETGTSPAPQAKALPVVAEQSNAKRPPPARRAPNTTPTTVAPAQPPIAAPAPPPAAASEPAKRAPPAALCADTNFVSHEICLQRECSSASMQHNPQCVRMRDRQKLLREGVGDGR